MYSVHGCILADRFILGRYKHAFNALERAESLLTRPDADIFYLLGALLLRKAEQNDTYNTMQAENPMDFRSKYLTEAKKYFLLSIEHDSRQVECFRKLSKVYMQESQISKAIEMLERCVL